ncbi:MAG: hypothetical protein JWP52_2420 [Rhizobacter sp.]|nr:hypothetical protein [Rhizobacter sp.]
MNLEKRSPLNALGLVLASVEAARNLRAMALLLGVFATAGLCLAMAESSLARSATFWAAIEAGAAVTVAFYGGSAAGLMMMDEARGVAVRSIGDALRASLAIAHRLLAVLIVMLAGYAIAAAVLLGLLWLCRLPFAGVALFGLVVPLAVVGTGLAALSMVAVVVPMTAPAVWSGLSAAAVLRQLIQLIRHRLLTVALLMSAVSLLTAGVGAIVTFVVMAGGRVVSQAAVLVIGINVQPQELMAGLFGFGLRSLGAAGAPIDATGFVAAAAVGGGVVFALALVLPGLVYLRGACTVYIALCESEPAVR